jgi:hypothetical protein
MKRIALTLLLMALTAPAGSDFTCPAGTEMACVEAGDKVCAAGTKCVPLEATCLQDFPCGPDEGFVCAGEHDAALEDCRDKIEQYEALIEENVDLRQERLDRKNCVLNSTTLADAQKCVR